MKDKGALSAVTSLESGQGVMVRAGCACSGHGSTELHVPVSVCTVLPAPAHLGCRHGRGTIPSAVHFEREMEWHSENKRKH